MKEWTIAVLPGDGIGPEVTAEAARALGAAAGGIWRGPPARSGAGGAAGGGRGARRVSSRAPPAPARRVGGQGERARGVAAVAGDGHPDRAGRISRRPP